MNTYELTFSEWRPGPYTGDFSEFGVLRVQVGPISFPVRIVMSSTLGGMLGYHEGDSNLRAQTREAMLHVAIPHLRAKLDAMDCPIETTDTIILSEDFGSEQAAILRGALTVKRCEFQVKTKRGLLCDAESNSDTLNGKTSEAVCLACNLPDDRVRCSNLQHPSITGTLSTGGKRRLVTNAFCGIKTGNFDAGRCRPGGHDCWRLNVERSEPIGDIPADVGERVVDELTFLNLAFKDAFGRPILRLNDPRTVASLLLPCETESDFTVRVAALADALSNLDVGEVLDEAGKPLQGSLNRLREHFKREDILLDEAPVRVLRSLVELRNSFPIHSGRDKFIASCRELGVPYPIGDWGGAWDRVRYHFWHSLRGLRQMIPASSEKRSPTK